MTFPSSNSIRFELSVNATTENQLATLDNGGKFHYNTMANGVWRSLVSRLVRVQEASGSNPDTPTNNQARRYGGLDLFPEGEA